MSSDFFVTYVPDRSQCPRARLPGGQRRTVHRVLQEDLGDIRALAAVVARLT